MNYFYTFFVHICFCCVLSAQAKLQGRISFYPEKKIVVKKYIGPYEEKLGEFLCDKKGKFNFQIPDAYDGILKFELENKTVFEIFSLGTKEKKINFNVYLGNEKGSYEVRYLTSSVKKSLKNYDRLDKIQQKILICENSIEKLELEKQSKKLKEEISPLILYNLSLNKHINEIKHVYEYNEKEKLKSIAQAHLKNNFLFLEEKQKRYLENSGKFLSFLIHFIYLNLIVFENEEGRIKKEIDDLLKKVDIKTESGQYFLTSFIYLFGKYELHGIKKKEFLDFFVSKAKNCNCNLIDELKEKIDRYETLEIGKRAPNIVFSSPIDKKYSQLYEIPYDYTLLVFWPASSPHYKESLKEIEKNDLFFKKRNVFVINILPDEISGNSKFNLGENWNVYRDSDKLISRLYDIEFRIAYFLLDRGKKILLKSYYLDNILSMLKQNLS